MRVMAEVLTWLSEKEKGEQRKVTSLLYAQ